jgi:hypothetical protein
VAECEEECRRRRLRRRVVASGFSRGPRRSEVLRRVL